jgi:lipopolysaccharide transport system permease protein
MYRRPSGSGPCLSSMTKVSQPINHPVTEIVIQQTRGWSWFSWRELYAYRDLLWQLARRDIVSRYKQTILGPLWNIIQPVLTTIVFMVIFSRVARIPTNGVPSSLFYMCGLLPWNFFSLTFQSTATTFLVNANMFGKVYFPRMIVPISSMFSNLVSLAIQLATFLAIFVVEKSGPRGGSFHLDAAIWILPLVFVQVALLSLGVGFWIAGLSAKFRDFAILSTFLLQLWMYATPVVLPLTRVPARWLWVFVLNPMTFPVEETRYLLLGAGTPNMLLFTCSIGITLLITVGGVFLFQRVEKNFVDVI